MRIRHLEIRNFRGIKSLSWSTPSDFICLIGAGDTCKTTILTALDYALSPRTSLSFDDADFFDQKVEDDIVIQATLSDWDNAQPEIKKFFQESAFARYQCGMTATGPIPEPNGVTAFSVSLRVDKSLEPKWSAVKGRDDGEVDKKPIWAAERALIGLSRIDFSNDAHFTWGRNTILTRLSEGTKEGLSGVVAALSRDMRKTDISGHPSIAECSTIADELRSEAKKTGVNLSELVPKIDVQRNSIGSGVISLHEGQVPLRNKGSGSKRLIGAAMQMKLHGGRNIAVVDEMELGLEPHRIRGLLHKLKQSKQQVFSTSHSAVVLRELDVKSDELWVCRRDIDGIVTVKSLNEVQDIQGPVRANAEAFLGQRIVVCEGATEVGLLRAYDLYRFDKKDPPVWSLSTAYFDCRGAQNVRRDADGLSDLGYRVAALCDNDAPNHLSEEDVSFLRSRGIHVTQWEKDKATEHQLASEMPWAMLPKLFEKIEEHHPSMTQATMLDCVVKIPTVAYLNLKPLASAWPDVPEIRGAIGDAAHNGKWIKRIATAQRVFEFALPHLPEQGMMMTRLAALWAWMQKNE